MLMERAYQVNVISCCVHRTFAVVVLHTEIGYGTQRGKISVLL